MNSKSQKTRKRRFQDYPKPVTRRWGRLKGRAWASAGARFYMRWILLWRERKRYRLMKDTLETFKKRALEFEQNKYEAQLAVINVGLYFLIAEMDIQAIKIDALTHPNAWKRNLCARILLLILHERDIDQVAGEPLRQALNDIHASEDLKKEVAEALRKVRKVQEKARKILGTFRNATIAHRDPDALLQYRAIRDLKSDEVFRLAMDFYRASERFTNLLPKVILQASSLEAMLSQAAKNYHKSSRNI